jgi:hypothetical protein
VPSLKLCCDTLGELNGGMARAMIDRAINDAVRDLEDRAEFDGKPRQVQVTLVLERLDNGQVAASACAMAKIPPMRVAGTISNLKVKDGQAGLLFSTSAPEQPDQKTIEDYVDFDHTKGLDGDDGRPRRGERRDLR